MQRTAINSLVDEQHVLLLNGLFWNTLQQGGAPYSKVAL
jgi:hypothetical protein